MISGKYSIRKSFTTIPMSVGTSFDFSVPYTSVMVTLEFVDFLRPERRFESPQELAAQLEADRNKVRQTIKLG